ncbi:hypothetical protein [Bradyrhizobium sp. CB1015]|uniref:hypothetical protein n=1 Tax=Bradyrhizobium sp. CB1015 TaxID=2976822 RepID=UPI0021AA2173|nr:hypothetical protein [Bradyrhizobium sp. CB1015]UWU90266.1 hypothetical protein N2604_27850 [Bradyrhizobium sp. CB1015]
MKRQLLIVTAITSIGSVAINQANGCTLQLPTFEMIGFPITRHQVAVLGSAQVEESAATPTLMSAGMPASPSQIAILTPRAKTIKIAGASADDLSLTVGTARLGLHKGAGRASCGSE